MRYLVTKSVVRVIGGIWMPYGAVCAMPYELTSSDVENAREDDGTITRESLEGWIGCHTGDFSSIQDWSADIADGESDIVFDWSDPESELVWSDCMYPPDD